MHIGEKIETIIHSRKSGSFGEYLGDSANTFGACNICGVIYKVERNIENPAEPMWVVRNINDATVAIGMGQWDLAGIKEIDFVQYC